MGRRFINIFSKPHFIFWGAIIILLITNFIKKSELEGSVLDINIHDTYFVVAHSHATYMACFFLAFIGLIYFTLNIFKLVLRTWLTIAHTLITVVGTLFLMYPISLIPMKQYEGFPTMPADLNTEIILVLLLIAAVQILLLLNISIGLIKKYNSK